MRKIKNMRAGGVWLARPRGRSAALAAALRRRGLRPVCCPALRLLPPRDALPLRQYAANPRRFSAHIFITAEAARAAARALPPAKAGAPSLPALAVGRATAAAVVASGRFALLAPPPAAFGGAKALLRLPPLRAAALAGKSVCVLGAEGARGAPPAAPLCAALRARGAQVAATPCYACVAIAPRRALLALAAGGRLQLALAYSGETARAMAAMLKENKAALRRLPLAAPAAGIVRAGVAAGFARGAVCPPKAAAGAEAMAAFVASCLAAKS